jgi:M6 family metalloprotease-like protein
LLNLNKSGQILFQHINYSEWFNAIFNPLITTIMKKNLFIAVLLLLSAVLLTAESYAGVAYPYPVQMKQSDGTVITVILHGDEYLKWAKTPDGYTLMYNSDGIYEYATRNQSGDLIPSGRKARDVSERDLSELSFLSGIEKNLFFSTSQVSDLRMIIDMEQSMRATTAFPTTGNAKLLCILIGFSDLAFTETQANFHNLFNQVGYGTYGSVKDYYEENSYGQFHLSVDVAGPYTAAHTHAYYGANNASGYDQAPRTLVTEAVNFADADVNYADYDNDGDGNVDGIYLIYAGYNEAEGGGEDCIWYHASSIVPVNLDGKNISAYSCSAEYKGNSGSNISGIGNICHEFGHVMGAPDFYDTDYEDGGQFSGNGRWDVMASGNFNGGRDCPAHYNPYTKANLFGWSTITVLDSQQEITILNSALHNDQFYRYNTTTAGEYFLMENKQKLGFDTKIPGHGLIIYHVHKDVATGGINKTHPQKFYPVCANAGTEPSANPADYGDINSQHTPFPGTGNKTEFTDATVPGSKSWAGANTGMPVAHISENTTTHTISLCFMGCPPVADFSADLLNPCSETAVNFTDLSAYEPTSWAWVFSPATVTFTGGTSASSQNPQVIFNAAGAYTVTLTATNAYGSDAEVKANYINVDAAPVVTTQPSDVAAQWGDDVSFTVAASGTPVPTVQWQRSTNGGSTFINITGETYLTLSLTCITLDMDGYQYRAIFTNRCGTATSDAAVLNVTEKSVTAAITVDPNPQQYSDLVDITIAIANGYTCGEQAATGADIYIGSQYMGTVTFSISGSDLTATLYDVALLEPVPFGTPPLGQMAPGNHEVTAVLYGENSNFDIDNPGATLLITCEDAEVTYNGGEFFTANPNNGNFSAALSAFVVDADDLSRGEIRNADITFTENDASGAVLGIADIPVGLIDEANLQEGFVTTDINGTLTNAEKSGGGRIYQVWAEAGNYYCGDIVTPVMVTITMPGDDYVTGGGHILMTNTSGLYPGLNNEGKKMNFGLVMKWNKSGKNLQGKVNVIYKGADGYNYQIKSNAINSLYAETVEEGELSFNKATITTKATLTQLLPDGALSLGGNLTLVITAWECTSENTGEYDRIGVQLAGIGGSGIWFTSNWSAGNTLAQTLNGGKIHVGMKKQKSGEISLKDAGENFNTSVQVYPNPSSGNITFEFQLDESSEATLDIYSVSGRMISRVYEGMAEGGELKTIHYNEMLPEGVYFYILRTDKTVKTGKFIRLQ